MTSGEVFRVAAATRVINNIIRGHNNIPTIKSTVTDPTGQKLLS